ncbi:MAG: hypothetical protein GY798_10000 [Hyphomicrobiales bacterium]|nr:hypothetical protein [Hyphomicrobiales bacterium]
MRDDNADWERLNAYLDDELPESDARAFEQRLAVDDGLRHELDRLRNMKRGLARMRPQAVNPAPPAPAPARSAFSGWAVTIAASLVVAVAAVAGALLFDSGPNTWLRHAEALHAEQSRQAYVVEERYVVQTVSSGHALEFRTPDLTASRLYLVNVATSRWRDRESIAVHYRGLHGCRLTLVAIEGIGSAGTVEVSETGDLVRTWLHGGFVFAVVANGMDVGRFESVADYAHAAVIDSIRDHDQHRLRTAMAQSQRRAAPCV